MPGNNKTIRSIESMDEERQKRREEILRRLQKDNIRFDCRHYSGYKPCGLSEFCEGCSRYDPRRFRILIIKLAALGDVLRTTPILTGLKKVYPQSHITWITDSSAFPLLKNNPHIDVLLPFRFGGVVSVMNASGGFDLALNFEKEDRALGLFAAVRASVKRGFAFSKAGTLSIVNEASLYALQLGLHDELKFRLNTETYQETLFKMAEIPYSGEDYVLSLSDSALDFARQMAKHLSLSPDRLRIGLNTGCGSVFETKRWTVQGFCDLARALNADGDCDLLLLGGAREKEMNQAILNQCGDYLHDTGCDNTLEEFMGIVSLCDVVVSSDSLAAHIALALKKQVVLFFGPTCPQEVELYDRGEKIVADFPCAPCYLKRCERLPRCMEKLDAGRVYEAVRRCMGKIDSLRKS